jgi:hypothetical protein
MPRQARGSSGNVIMPATMLLGADYRHCRTRFKTVCPSTMRRHREQQASEEVRVLNVPEIEEETPFDAMNWDFGQPLSNAGGEMEPNKEQEGEWVECNEIYHELLDGVRRV